MDRLPTLDTLKTQARRLRTSLTEAGTAVSHSQSLELVAHSHGLRDWNTAFAMASAQTPLSPWQIGQHVRGTYLGHAFTARIKAAAARADGSHSLTLVFDTPIDVVQSAHFSNLRRQVRVTVAPNGATVEKTSNGQPHLQLAA